MINQEDTYASNRTSRFIEQANEAIYCVEERERLGIVVTDNNNPIKSEHSKKRITRIRKSFTRIKHSSLIESAREAILVNNYNQK